MEFGLYLRDTCSNPGRPMYQQIEETAELVRHARNLRFSYISAPHHWVSYPTVWPQPIPLLARLAPEAEPLRLLTAVIQLPLCNPVELAEELATLDHISNGRLICGVGLGYRETELEAAGATRKERAPRTEEAVELMKLLWSGEEVTFEGRFWRVHGARMGAPPVQRPHPPLWMAAQSPGAVRRAGLLGDGCILGPQAGWAEVRPLSQLYRESAASRGLRGFLASRRSVSVARDRKAAEAQARAKAEAHFNTYARWDMQEGSMVELRLSFQRELTDWAIVGSPQECVETLSHFREELGLDSVNLGFLNLPAEQEARLDYLRYVSEEVLAKVD